MARVAGFSLKRGRAVQRRAIVPLRRSIATARRSMRTRSNNCIHSLRKYTIIVSQRTTVVRTMKHRNASSSCAQGSSKKHKTGYNPAWKSVVHLPHLPKIPPDSNL